MKLIGQRWRYRVGNSQVDVDNGFSWSLRGQERLSINGAVVRKTGGRLRLFQRYAEPWLTPLGDGQLSVVLRARRLGIACMVTLDGEPVEPEQLFEVRWAGTGGDWPEESAWQPVVASTWIARQPN